MGAAGGSSGGSASPVKRHQIAYGTVRPADKDDEPDTGPIDVAKLRARANI